MYRRIFIIFTLVIVSIYSFGQEGSKMAAYNSDTIATLTGVIKSTEIKYNYAMEDMGLHLTIDTSEGDYIVHVCPEWYSDNRNLEFLIGEIVTVEGSTFIKEGQLNIYAATITRKFCSLSEDKQLQIAEELRTSSDLSSIVDNYGCTAQEVENMKIRIDLYFGNDFQSALFPQKLRLRDLETGAGLWTGRDRDS